MKKHHIYVSDSIRAESVADFYIESDLPTKEVVNAAALQAIFDNDISKDSIESIFSIDAMQNFYGVVIQCTDYHISVWEGRENIPTRTIEQKYFDIANDISILLSQGIYDDGELSMVLESIYNENDEY